MTRESTDATEVGLDSFKSLCQDESVEIFQHAFLFHEDGEWRGHYFQILFVGK